MTSNVINFAQKLARFSEHWSPRVVAEMNDYQFKLVKFEGEFVWHDHKDTDEVFIVLHGEMEIGFKDRTVTVRAREMFVVPKGVEHITRAARECQALLVVMATYAVSPIGSESPQASGSPRNTADGQVATAIDAQPTAPAATNGQPAPAIPPASDPIGTQAKTRARKAPVTNLCGA